jgi:hypothetical protein
MKNNQNDDRRLLKITSTIDLSKEGMKQRSNENREKRQKRRESRNKQKQQNRREVRGGKGRKM